jgi:hypothetical protein
MVCSNVASLGGDEAGAEEASGVDGCVDGCVDGGAADPPTAPPPVPLLPSPDEHATSPASENTMAAAAAPRTPMSVSGRIVHRLSTQSPGETEQWAVQFIAGRGQAGRLGPCSTRSAGLQRSPTALAWCQCG